jgi:hypothetical protein
VVRRYIPKPAIRGTPLEERTCGNPWTVGPRLDDLLSVSGPQVGVSPASINGLPADLGHMLTRRNGFVVFESALHVLAGRPAGEGVMTIQQWNEQKLWRVSYDGLADGLLFFAEDVFGGQFALGSTGVVMAFDPETGAVEQVASDLEDWADRMLSEYAILTGFPVAHAWQELHGPIPAGQRLIPKRPFVLGGEFSPENLYLLDAAEGMRLRGSLAVQIRDLPDGATVSYVVGD